MTTTKKAKNKADFRLTFDAETRSRITVLDRERKKIDRSRSWCLRDALDLWLALQENELRDKVRELLD